MKKLLFIAMVIASVSAKAQTSTECYGIIPILTGDSVVFDLTEYPFEDITLHLNKKDGSGNYCFEYDIDLELKDGADFSLYNTLKCLSTNYSNPTYLYSNSQFPMTIGNSYSITYCLPSSFHYKYYYNYYLNYNSIFIKICAINGDGEIMGTFNVAELPISVMMNYDYPSFQYWDCSGLQLYNSLIYNETYYADGMLTAHRIIPLNSFADLWYTEYDEGDPNWKQHSAFVAEIDHFAIGIAFWN